MLSMRNSASVCVCCMCDYTHTHTFMHMHTRPRPFRSQATQEQQGMGQATVATTHNTLEYCCKGGTGARAVAWTGAGAEKRTVFKWLVARKIFILAGKQIAI